MKLLNASQINKWDAYTIANEPIASIDLMERAAQECVWSMGYGSSHFGKKIYVFCGRGNNGGDGLAIARLLQAQSADVQVFALSADKKGSLDFEINRQRWEDAGNETVWLQTENDFPLIPTDTIIIDALFGSGLNKPLEGLARELVFFLNAADAVRISIDVPSGMFLDKSSEGSPILKATETYTFQRLNYCFLLPENAAYSGNVSVLDIGLDGYFPEQQDTTFEMVDKRFAASIYKPRNEFAHKGTYGHALLVAGNRGKMGAAVLAAKSCLRTGVGLLTCNIPESEALVLPIAVPEAMTNFREAANELSKYNAIGIGPGLGTDELLLLEKILSDFAGALVLDADALNMMSRHKDLLSKIPPNAILTPHPKEFDRLFGVSDNDDVRIQKAIALSSQYPFTIVLKGHYTLVAQAGKGYFNTTGNAGLATGGSGDTLTGILLSLLAQKYGSRDAAVLGVFLHGLAADLALGQQSMESLLPSDLDLFLGQAFKALGRDFEDY